MYWNIHGEDVGFASVLELPREVEQLKEKIDIFLLILTQGA